MSLLNDFQKQAYNYFDEELRLTINQMYFNWIKKPFEEMFNFNNSSLEDLCDYYEIDLEKFSRILRNNNILDCNNRPTEFGIKTGLVKRTPFGNPEMN